MNILAVDTSSQSLIVALKTDTWFEERNIINAAMQHSESLMPVIKELLENARLSEKDIDLFVCSRGPGSFTGLRIGMATLKGLAYGLGKPLVSVSTLEMWASTVEDFKGLVIPVIDAKKQRFYLSAFECRDCSVKRIMNDTDGTIADLQTIINPYSSILLTGPDKDLFYNELKTITGDRELLTEYENALSPSVSLIELGVKQFNNLGPDDIGQGPVYIRKSDAEVALEERLKEKKDD